MTKQRALVVCPGRGTYNKAELGYLKKHHRPVRDDFIHAMDERLKARGEPTVSELDGAAQFSLRTHTPGEFASTLIFTCSAADWQAIDRDKFDVVAVTGNSMGWYTTLWAAGATDDDSAFSIIHTMGSMMRNGIIGGQLIYPLVNEHWQHDSRQADILQSTLDELTPQFPGALHLSIRFGGYAIIGGETKALQALKAALPVVDERYPMILVNHAAFHTPLLRETAVAGQAALGSQLFGTPKIPMIDGRGHVWQPWATDRRELRAYTLGHQVYAPYDFSAAMAVGLKEFAPDVVILLGPGGSLGGAVGQVMIQERWQGLQSKADFVDRQAEQPLVLALGRPEQRPLGVASER